MMFTKEDLQELVAYQAEGPLLSVYLDVDPTELTTEEYKLALRQMLKQANGAATPADLTAVENYFSHEYDWSGRGVAVFSRVKEDFWRAYSFAVPVSSNVTVARKPYIWPLAALLDAYGSYAVALVDRQELRLMLFAMGELQTTEKISGEEVRRLKKGRGSSGGPGRRGGAPISSQREEEVAQRNIREAAKATERFFRKYGPRRLILAGAEPTLPIFRDELPKSLEEKIIGEFSADMNASELEVGTRSLEIVQAVERKREDELLETVYTEAAKGRNGVIRLDDTLGAAHEGRVQTLVIAHDFHRPGYRCQNCAYITDHALETCPFCGGQFAEIPDATEALIAKVIEDGGRVDVVDKEEHPKIAQFGVGALLRY